MLAEAKLGSSPISRASAPILSTLKAEQPELIQLCESGSVRH
jgi:hypothetical protein